MPPAPPAKPESQAPATYSLKVPDDARALLPPTHQTRLEEMARTAGLSNEDAQTLLDEHVALVTQTAAAFKAETVADREIGGDHLAETQKLAQRAIDRMLPAGHAWRAGFDAYLAQAGAGSNLHVLRFLSLVGKALGEDAPPAGSTTGAKKTAEELLYDHPTSVALEKAAGGGA